MDCDKALELISLYIDGELNKEEQEEIIRHMERCESCRKEYESIKEMVEELNNIDFLPLPDGYHERLMQKINDTKVEKVDFAVKESKKGNHNNHNWKKYGTMVAGLCLVAIVGAGGNVILNGNHTSGSAASDTAAAPARSYLMNSPEAAGAGDMSRMAEPQAEMPMEMPMKETEMEEAVEAGYGMSQQDGGVSQESPSVSGMDLDNAALEERKKIKTSYLTIEVDNFENAAEFIKNEAESKGGYVQNFNSYIYYEDKDNNISLKSGNITIRVAKEQYDPAKNSIKTIGDVSYEDEYVDDVTSQYVDTEGKLKAKRTEEERLLALLEKAETVQDIVAIEERLSDVRGYIESYQSMINNWDKLVGLSTISVEIKEEMPSRVGNISSDFGDRIKDSFITSINILVDGFQNIVLGLVAVSMPLVVGVVIVAVVVVIVKGIMKKRKKNKKQE